MKLSFKKPSDLQIRSYVDSLRATQFTYEEQQATQSKQFPPGYFHDFNQIELGKGEKIFLSAKSALEQLLHFPESWTQPFSWHKIVNQLNVGDIICLRIRQLKCWFLTPCRILYLIDKTDQNVSQFGFAYGTLKGHPESGEECFKISWDQTSDRVHYQIYAFSRPNHFLTWLGFPIVRRLQKKFVQDSFKKMQKLSAQ